jgi:hypothetical protein
MTSIRKLLVTVSSLAVMGVAGYCVSLAIHSPLFLVQVIEINGEAENSPLDSKTLSSLAAVPIGKVNLFALDLRAIELRMMSNPWIREVRLTKRFPQTLSIGVTFKEPLALTQAENGNVSYVDVTGKAFGNVDLSFQPDLPILVGIADDSRMAKALTFIRNWNASPIAKLAQISTLSWDAEKGFRLWVSYSITHPSKKREIAKRDSAPLRDVMSRPVIELGTDLQPGVGSEEVDAFNLQRLSDVLSYLSSKSIASHQIWADSGKKIVVKTAHGS